jgi:tripartite-type tricarboxylate transporter receptor subunit TctC
MHRSAAPLESRSPIALFTGCLLFLLLFLPLVVSAAIAPTAGSYPSHPVKIIVPYAPGGATDVIARILAVKLSEPMSQSVVVENRPGASGNIALEAVARAPADGYTLLVGNVSTNAINETTFGHVLQIKPSRDLTGITKLVEIPHVVVVNPAFPVTSVSELLAEARRKPDRINFASAGIGSYPHLDMEKLMKMGRVQMMHVPYKGGAGQMIPALLSGESQVAFINLSSVLGHVRSGRLRVIATTTAERLRELPDAATLADQGYAGVGTNAWQGLFAPAGTPKPVVEKLYQLVAASLQQPEVKDNLSKQMMTLALSRSPEEWTESVRKETLSWGEFVREAKVRIE